MKSILSLLLLVFYLAVYAQPLLYEAHELSDSNGTSGDKFGSSVSLSFDGNTALIGAAGYDVDAFVDEGIAYVWVKSANTWTLQAKLIPVEGDYLDQVGASVSISGDGNTALIGAPFSNIGSNFNQGCAYVFVRTGNLWTQQARLIGPGGAQSDAFGFSVSLSDDGNTALIGVHQDLSVPNLQVGSAYVFVRDGTTWTVQTQLLVNGGSVGDNIGFSLDLSDDGNTAILGARLDEVNGQAYQGSATVFVRSGTVWTQQSTLTASNGDGNDLFGTSVSLSADGNLVLIGSSQKDNYSGRVYIFSRSNTIWSEIAQINNPNGLNGGSFGIGVRLSASGQFALIGSTETVGANMGQGASYVFSRTGNAWVQKAKLLASNGGTEDNMGIEISFSGDGNTAACGIENDDVGDNQNQGRVLIFDMGAVLPTQELNSKVSFRIYPSPTTGHITIESDEVIDDVWVLNLLGETVLQEKGHEFDLYGMPPGTYLIRLKINGIIHSCTVSKI